MTYSWHLGGKGSFAHVDAVVLLTPVSAVRVPTLTYASPADPPLRAFIIRAIEVLSGRRTLEHHYAQTAGHDAKSFWAAALDQLDVTPVYDADRLRALPVSGPLVVVANHPFGVLDGLMLCHLVSQVRPAFRILLNDALCRDPRLDAHFLPVDFQGTAAARRTNRRSIRSALATLQADGTVIVFPAGGIATAPRPFADAEDLPWKPLVGTLVQAAGATVVPMHISGQNSRLFQWASQVSLTLRLSLIIHEAVRKIGTAHRIRIGTPRPYADLPQHDTPAALTRHLRSVTFSLADRAEPSGSGAS